MDSLPIQQLPRRKVKLVFVGDAGVGKTSIMSHYVLNRFENKYSVTIGIDFFSKTIISDKWYTRLHIWDTAGLERFRSLIPSYVRDAAIAVVVYDITSKKSFEHAKDWIEYVRASTQSGCDTGIVLVGNKMDLAKELKTHNDETHTNSNNTDNEQDNSENGENSENSENKELTENHKNIISNDKNSGKNGNNEKNEKKSEKSGSGRAISFEEGSKLASDYNISFLETSAKTGENISKLFETAITDLDAKNAILIKKNTEDNVDLVSKVQTAKVDSDDGLWCCLPWSLFWSK